MRPIAMHITQSGLALRNAFLIDCHRLPLMRLTSVDDLVGKIIALDPSDLSESLVAGDAVACQAATTTLN